MGGYIYAFGGCDNRGTCLASAERFHPGSTSWGSAPSMSKSRDVLAAAVLTTPCEVSLPDEEWRAMKQHDRIRAEMQQSVLAMNAPYEALSSDPGSSVPAVALRAEQAPVSARS